MGLKVTKYILVRLAFASVLPAIPQTPSHLRPVSTSALSPDFKAPAARQPLLFRLGQASR